MTTRILDSIEQVGQGQWRRVELPNYPFFDYENLGNYESSGCVGPSTGWQPRYLTLWQGEDLLAASPFFIKDHSYGEYIFDWAWAQAYQQAGMEYYPKLLSATPFTPATATKFLVSRDAQNPQTLQKKLIQSALELSQDIKTSGVHFLFIAEEDIAILREQGFFIRKTYQFRWMNRGYTDFDHYLSFMKKKPRKQILRERAKVRDQGVEIVLKTGSQLQASDLQRMYELYLNTLDDKWSHPYLTLNYFLKTYENLKDRVLLAQAKIGEQVVAQSLSFIKGNGLFGRYWGSTAPIDCLHFELCYYSLLEYAIENRYDVFEAGAQGPQKFKRGFLPEYTYSAHFMHNPQFHQLLEDFCNNEANQLQQAVAHSRKHNPFKDSL